jgi:hypothetical protein
VSLVLIAEQAVADESDLPGLDGLAGELPQGLLLQLFEAFLRRSDMSIPQAENTAACLGITTFLIPSSTARAQACIPPPPPNAIIVYSRGSWPRLTDTSFRALTMLLLAIRTIPRAASLRSVPSFLASLSRAFRTPSMSAVIVPPQKYSGLIVPSSRLASVVVASVPPLA